MSGFVCYQGADRIVLLTDGGYWTLWQDEYVLTSLCSKAITIPRLGVMIASVGTGDFVGLTRFNQSHNWQSFDDLVGGQFAEDAEFTRQHLERNFPRRRIACVGVICGYSESRDRFEKHTFEIIDEEENGRAILAANEEEMVMIPQPNEAALQRVGLMRDGRIDVHLNHDAFDYEDLARLMQAQRFTRTPMGMHEPQLEGFCIAGFIERTVLLKGGVLISSIVHRWNDELEKVVDPEIDPMLPRQFSEMEKNNG